MTELNWRRITDGPTFQRMMMALIGSLDPEARLFGRPGQDAAQDTRSGDGETVFQAKFHEKASMAKVIGDARDEADKIERYRMPSDSRSALWCGVSKWTMVTNFDG